MLSCFLHLWIHVVLWSPETLEMTFSSWIYVSDLSNIWILSVLLSLSDDCPTPSDWEATEEIHKGRYSFHYGCVRGGQEAHLDDQVPLWITSHPAELGSKLLELGPAVGVDHPAWTRNEGKHTWIHTVIIFIPFTFLCCLSVHPTDEYFFIFKKSWVQCFSLSCLLIS